MQYQLSQTGYSLVEVLIAISVLLLSLAGPLTIASKSLQTSFNARDQVVATYLAQEGLEGVVAAKQDSTIAAIRSGNFSDMWNWTNSGALVDNGCFGSNGCNFDMADTSVSDFKSTVEECDTSTSCQVTMDGKTYTRVITLDNIGGNGDTVEATITVTWENASFSGSNREVVISTLLFDVYGNL